MRILLDTHIAIWSVATPDRLSPIARRIVTDEADAVYVSAASIWEIAIKYPLGRKTGAPPFDGATAIGLFLEAGFELLDIRPEHAAAVAQLPDIHSDPFDRLLIAQARREGLLLPSDDPVVRSYGESVLQQ